MASAEFTDPYLDPDTGILRNRAGARTRQGLDAVEGALAFVRLVQLMDHPQEPTADLAELRAIHRHLFQDVFDWAGQIRTVDMRKNTEGAEFFLPVSMIERAAGYAADELRAEHRLHGLSRGEFVERLAHHYDQFNYIHPFREGNGRAQRVFWNRIALAAGWQLDWRPVLGRTNDEACRAATERRDFAPLLAMFDSITTPAAPSHERGGAWQAAESLRLAFGTPEPDAEGGRP